MGMGPCSERIRALTSRNIRAHFLSFFFPLPFPPFLLHILHLFPHKDPVKMLSSEARQKGFTRNEMGQCLGHRLPVTRAVKSHLVCSILIQRMDIAFFSNTSSTWFTAAFWRVMLGRILISCLYCPTLLLLVTHSIKIAKLGDSSSW